MRSRKEKEAERSLNNIYISPAQPSRFEGKTDASIWNAFLEGDEGALVHIYRKYSGILFNYGCQFTGRKELVGDCIQELFLELIGKRTRLNSTTSIKFYLLRALRRRLARQIKRDSRMQLKEQVAEGSFLIDFQHEPTIGEPDQQNDNLKQKLKMYCNQLPARQREAILLFFYEGLSYQEITNLMELGQVKSARTLIYRALESLSGRINLARTDLEAFLLFVLPLQ